MERLITDEIATALDELFHKHLPEAHITIIVTADNNTSDFLTNTCLKCALEILDEYIEETGLEHLVTADGRVH